MCPMLQFQHPGTTQETLPVGLSPPLTGPSTELRQPGAGSPGRGCLFGTGSKAGASGISSRWEGHLKAVTMVTREETQNLEISSKSVKTSTNFIQVERVFWRPALQTGVPAAPALAGSLLCPVSHQPFGSNVSDYVSHCGPCYSFASVSVFLFHFFFFFGWGRH